MPSVKSVTHDNFRLLLNWLDVNDEVAGREYERIRQRLIRIFACRGCYEPELLADQTIDRVTIKAPQIVKDYVGKADLYFYGVANKIHLEWLRKQERERPVVIAEVLDFDLDEIDDEFESLESCLEGLSSGNRELILEYYAEEKQAKIIHRKHLALKMGITVGALQIRASRIRSQLLDCLNKKGSRKS